MVMPIPPAALSSIVISSVVDANVEQRRVGVYVGATVTALRQDRMIDDVAGDVACLGMKDVVSARKAVSMESISGEERTIFLVNF